MTNLIDFSDEQVEGLEPYLGDGFKKKKKTRIVPLVISLSLVSALIGGGVGGTLVGLQDQHDGTATILSVPDNSTNTVANSASNNLSDIIAAKLKSVVTISAVSGNNGGTGSGVILDKEGYIVTNAHVATLEGATDKGTLTVQTNSGKTYPAKLVGYDSVADLAVVKIDAPSSELQPIIFANSSGVKVGSETIAIGSPLGLSGTVTTGIVSALNRPITVSSSEVLGANTTSSASSTIALSAIQTDASINAGNSGGALLDAKGNLIGINVAIASAGATASGNAGGSIGVGFAIPSDYVKRIALELINDGKGTHATLGASLADYKQGKATFSTGAEIKTLSPGAAAEKSGLKVGDVVTKVDGTIVESSSQLAALIKQQKPGTSIQLTYERAGKEATVSIVLG